MRKLFGTLNRKSIPELYEILQTHQEEEIFSVLFGYIEELYKEELADERKRLKIDNMLSEALLKNPSFSKLVEQSNSGLTK